MLTAWAKALQAVIDEALLATVNEFGSIGLCGDDIAISLVDIRDRSSLVGAGHRQHELIYPASVIKLFYAVAAYQLIEADKLKRTDELDRAIQDMLVVSSNDATSYVVDVLTDTTSGPELAPLEMASWTKKRNVINEHFKALGYQLNANQKPWSDGPYGRERIFVGSDFANRNKLSTADTARLLGELVLKKACLPKHCEELLVYIRRDGKARGQDEDDQSCDFIAGILPADARCWSKAGWTSTARHDAAYIELKGGAQFLLVIFTNNHAREHRIMRSCAERIVEKMACLVGTV